MSEQETDDDRPLLTDIFNQYIPLKDGGHLDAVREQPDDSIRAEMLRQVARDISETHRLLRLLLGDEQQ